MVNTWNAGYGGQPGGGRRAGRVQPGCLVIRPLKWLGMLIILIGVAVMAITAPWGDLTKLVRGSADAVGDVEPGGIEEIELSQPGEWIIYAEGDNVVDDCGEDLCEGDFIEPEVIVADADGNVLPLAESNLSISDTGTESTSLWSFDVDEAMTVTIAMGPETDIDRIAIAKAPEFELEELRGVGIGAAIIFVGIVFRIIVGVVGSFFRS